MANKRMFSIKIIDTDLFLDMPVSTRLLYYDLAMRADDDGFVGSPKKITKMIGCSDDDLKLLCAKQFLIPFESGICVIKDWKIHNTIQKDRYVKTQYTSEKNQLNTDFNGSFFVVDEKSSIVVCEESQSNTDLGDFEKHKESQLNTDFNGMNPLCIQVGNSLETQTRHRQEQDKIRLEQDKIRLEQDKTSKPYKLVNSYYEENIGIMTSTVLSDVMFFLEKDVDENLIIKCLTKAVFVNARVKWNYAKGILNNLLDEGIVTLEAFEKREQEKKYGSNAGNTGNAGNAEHVSVTGLSRKDSSNTSTEHKLAGGLYL